MSLTTLLKQYRTLDTQVVAAVKDDEKWRELHYRRFEKAREIVEIILTRKMTRAMKVWLAAFPD
jgi:ribosomal protein L16/L10AE